MYEEPGSVDEETASALTSLLTEKSIPQLSGTEQLSLADIIQCIGTVEKHRRSIDENAARFLLSWRESLTRSRQPNYTQHKPTLAGAITWREMVWAYHSSSQDILVATITSYHKGRLEWSHARDTGIFMWLTDREALLAQFEAVARNAYTANDPRNPVDCALYYLALHKKAVLQGLWRMATWSREQAATTRLLKNDFTDPRWKTAAAKNAYALMGKRRFEYAAAFFLLADDLKSAVNVLSNQHGDSQLAIAVARVYGGDDSPVLKEFLRTKILPMAAQEGNRWQATWCYWLLGDRSLSVQALVNPLHSLLDPPGSPPDSLRAKSFLNDDPALVVLYKQLREKSLQTLQGALMISGKQESQFITTTANLLLRMGCDILALDLVRNWEFLQQPASPRRNEDDEGRESIADLPQRNPTRSSLQDYEMDPRKMLRRRSSLVVADLPSPSVTTESMGSSMLDEWSMPQSNRKQEPAPARSMLDDWGTTPEHACEAAPARSMLDDWGMTPEPNKQEASQPLPTPKDSGVPSDSQNQTLPIRPLLNGQEIYGNDRTKPATAKPEENGQKPTDGSTTNGKNDEKKPPPTQFKEPDPNSLLDAFGF